MTIIILKYMNRYPKLSRCLLAYNLNAHKNSKLRIYINNWKTLKQVIEL